MNIDHYLDAIKSEEERNTNFLHLTANENQLSKTARMFLGSKINERYFFGGGNENKVVESGSFVGTGFKSVEGIVSVAKDAAKEMLGAYDVNLNVLSGVHAMMSAILATTEVGDTIMTVPKEAGGHFATKGILGVTGREHVYADYDFENLRFDTDKIKEKFKKSNVKAIYLDVSYYLNPHNLQEIRNALGDKPIIIYDASHTMGLIMGQRFQSPLKEGANVVCANTHKTLPGPHKGMIAFRDKELAEKANGIIDGSLYSTPHITHLIALSVTILEMKEFGQSYADQIILNSNAMGMAFEELGYEVGRANTGRYSENHQTHIYINDKGNHIDLYKKLLDNNISTNFEGEEFSRGRWFIRIGTAEVTRRGMKERDMETIARFMNAAFAGLDVKNEVLEFNKSFSNIYYSFDNSFGLNSNE